MGFSIKQVDSNHENLLALIQNLDQYLFERYPEEEVFGIDFSDPSIEDVIFMVAYDNEIPVGCGAIRPLGTDMAEVKRFYVEPEYRNKGIAAQILRQLEQKARDLQYGILRLETGDELPEAVNFYKKHGFYVIERYGEYVDSESSLCFEKQLGH